MSKEPRIFKKKIIRKTLNISSYNKNNYNNNNHHHNKKKLVHLIIKKSKIKFNLKKNGINVLNSFLFLTIYYQLSS